MQTTNFLPGMNPFLQARWPDAHTRLIAYIGDSLNERLPSDLAVIAEESISIDFEETDVRLQADVAVVEQPILRFPDSIPAHDDTSTLTLAEPETIHAAPTQRWLEIRDVDNHLVSVIELLGPSNKTPRESANLARRHEQLIHGGVNVIEIDLIRGGLRTLPDALSAELKDNDIPLRRTDKPVPLDLQPLIDRCYQTGRYWQLSQRPLPPPALPADEQAWLDQHRIAAGLIDASV